MTVGGPIPDLEPAARALRTLVREVPDELLVAPTPCPDWTVGDLLDHIMATAAAFYTVATKAGDAAQPGPPHPSGANLGDEWRARLRVRLDTLIAAWREPAAWQGTVALGGMTLPARVAGLVVLNELVVHGWDLARAAGRDYQIDQRSLETVYGLVAQQRGPAAGGAFGPPVTQSADAPLLDRIIGLTGRNPDWKP